MELNVYSSKFFKPALFNSLLVGWELAHYIGGGFLLNAVCVAIGELAPGLRIDLDAVRKKYDGLDGTEIAISESQERMAVVVAAEDADKFIALAQAENLEAYRVAIVTEEERMVMTWKGQTIANLSRAFLDTNGASKHTKVDVTAKDLRAGAALILSALAAKGTMMPKSMWASLK